ncbi:MAG: chorismate synthase [Bacteroidetes bacterium GWF2_41_61]|jgi:chorismate synthase|nr:MAG: chorismate synthase [Bacteroidetes bacterium GWF2_41_61]OFY88540.1 MAG: chorismate synthase [Bacteroidetes bacterium RIFOXYA12_FULL_40_10]PKP07066.1 MAG: chorismate synthase [Bacteroidetes bacterium HGW-Bacteroidetes-5]
MNSFGSKFRVTLFGESHGPAIGVVIDGIPAGISITTDEFREDLLRRSGGKKGGTPRVEEDSLQFLSGVFNGFTTGSPVAVVVNNLNTRSADYDSFANSPRPGHADFVSKIKHNGFADPRGGGHHSGRVTLALVIAGIFAKKIISPVTIETKIIHIGGENPWDKKLDEALAAGDSLGGVIECTIKGLPAGVGEPFFDSLESLISHIVFAIPGIRGIEFGDGFASARMWGSQHNDPILSAGGATLRNGAGGINGGISNGNDIIFRIAVKPTSSISKVQHTFNFAKGVAEDIQIEGRHDTCFALRVPVVLEAVTAIAISNLLES